MYLRQGNPQHLLHRCINNESLDNFAAISNLVISRSEYNYIINSLFPESYERIGTLNYGIGCSNSFYRSFFWTTCIIVGCANKINLYLKHKSVFENCLLIGDYEGAQKQLDIIETEICYSYWSLKNRILLKNTIGEDPIKYINNLNLSNNTKQLAIIFSSLTDRKDDYYQYRKNINELLKPFSAENKNYFYCLFGMKDELINENPNEIMRLVSFDSIIDIYNTVKCVFGSEIIDLDSEKYTNIIHLINSKIIDKKFIVAEKALKEEKYTISKLEQTLLTNFKNKQFEELINEFSSNIHSLELSDSFYMILLLSYSLKINEDYSHFNNDTILGEIIISIQELIYNNNYFNFQISSEKLLQFSKILDTFPLSEQLVNLVQYFTSGYLELDLWKKCNSLCDLAIIECIISFDLPPIFPDSIIAINNDIDQFELLSLLDENNPIYETAKKRIMFELAIFANECFEAVKVLSELIIENNMAYYNLKIDTLEEYVEMSIAGRKPIDIYMLVFIFSNNKFIDIRPTMFKNFLNENSISLPIQICDLDFDEKFKVYFLYSISKRNMLEELYKKLKSDDDIDDYRIQILKKLISLDRDNQNIYNNEISKISKEISLRIMQSDIDESKLSVDFDYIKKELISSFTSKTRKFFDVSQNNMSFVNPNSIAAQRTSSDLEWQIIGNTRLTILEDMYTEYAEEFCFGHKGLDTFLSTRIRHGVFSHELLNVFINENIIYSRNSLYKGFISSGQLSEDAVIILDTFSKKITDIINWHTEKAFKVFINESIDDAIFDYSFTSEDLDYILLHKDYTDCRSVIGFIDIISDCIINKTNNYLDMIKEDVLEKLNKNMIQLLSELSKTIKPCCLNDSCYEVIVNNITVCKTKIQKEIELIKNWFNLSTDVFSLEYSWNDLIDVTKIALRKQIENFDSISISTTDRSTSHLKGESFSYWYDIFQIALNNSIQHSEYENYKRLKINIFIDENDYDYIITITNNLSSKVNKKELEQKVEKINAVFLSKEYNRGVNKEGGSGIIKIMHILFNIMNFKGKIYVEIRDNLFILLIQINKDGVVCDN